jgi:hypothetical protein
MFKTIAIVGILVAAVGFVVSAMRRRPATADGGAAACPRLGWVDKGIYAIMFFGLLVGVVTGLGSVFTRGHMGGWALMVHVGLAPAFMLGMAGVAVTLADRCRFTRSETGGTTFGGWENFLFWVMLVATLIAILSAVLPMTPVFGTDGQHTSLDVHRYSSLVAAVAVILHAGRLLSYRGGGTPARKAA